MNFCTSLVGILACSGVLFASTELKSDTNITLQMFDLNEKHLKHDVEEEMYI